MSAETAIALRQLTIVLVLLILARGIFWFFAGDEDETFLTATIKAPFLFIAFLAISAVGLMKPAFEPREPMLSDRDDNGNWRGTTFGGSDIELTDEQWERYQRTGSPL